MLAKYLYLVLFLVTVLAPTVLFSQKLDLEWAVSGAWGQNQLIKGYLFWTKLSPNRERILTFGGNRLITVTNTKTGHTVAVVRQLAGDLINPRVVEWLDNNRFVAYYYQSASTVKNPFLIVFDITKKDYIEKILPFNPNLSVLARVDSATFLAGVLRSSVSPQQDYDDKIYKYNVQKEIFTDSIIIRHKSAIGHSICDGNTIAITTTDGIIRIWDRITKKFVKELNTGLTDIRSIDYNEVAGFVLINNADRIKRVVLWDVKNDKVQNFSSGSGIVDDHYMNLSKNGDAFIVPTKSNDNTMYRMYETSSGKEIRSFNPDIPPSHCFLFLSTIDEVIYSTAFNNFVNVFDTKTSRIARTLHFPENSIEDIKFSKAGSYVAYSCEPNIIISDMKSTLVKDVINARVKTLFTFLSDDILAYTKDRFLVALYNVSEQKEINTFKTGDQEISSITTTQDGKKILIGTVKGRILEYDIPKNFSQRVVVDIGQRVYYCHYDEQRQRLITVSQDPNSIIEEGLIKLYNYNTGSSLPISENMSKVAVREQARKWRSSEFNSGVPVIAINNSNSEISIGYYDIWRWDIKDSTNGEMQYLFDTYSHSISYIPNNDKNLVYASASEQLNVLYHINLDTKQKTRLTDDYPYNPRYTSMFVDDRPMQWLCTAVSPDGKYVAAGNNYGQLACFRLSGVSSVNNDEVDNSSVSSRGMFRVYNQNTITVSDLVLPCRVVISTLLGQEVLTREITGTENLNIGDLPNGFYTIALIGSNQTYYGSFIK